MHKALHEALKLSESTKRPARSRPIDSNVPTMAPLGEDPWTGRVETLDSAPERFSSQRRESPHRRRRSTGKREHHKWDSLESFTLDSASSHNSHPAEEEDIVDPLDTSRLRRSALLAPLEPVPLPPLGEPVLAPSSSSRAGEGTVDGRVPFPAPDYPLARRASVDLGGLGLALPPLERSPGGHVPSPQASAPASSSTSNPLFSQASHPLSSIPYASSTRTRSISSPRLSIATNDRSDKYFETTTTNAYPTRHNSSGHPQPSLGHAQPPHHPTPPREVFGWGWAGFDIDSESIYGQNLTGGLGGMHIAEFEAGPWGRRGTVVPGRATAELRALGARTKSKGGEGGGSKAPEANPGGRNPGSMFDVEDEGDGLG